MRLAFWKKKKEPEMPKGFDMSTPDMGKDRLGLPEAKDDLGLGAAPGAAADLGLPGAGGMPDMPEMPAGMAQETGAGAPQAFPRLEEARPQPSPVGPTIPPPAEHAAFSGKDLEIISLKLDSLKTTLESINERLARLEKTVEGERESPRF